MRTVNRVNPIRAVSQRFDRRGRQVYREVIRRRLPHGVIHWRYLRPGRDERIRLHRRFWWQSRGRWPRILWGLLEAWLWFRWVSWSGWWASARAVRRLGPTVVAEEGIGLRAQYGRVLRLTLAWSISPADVYRFRLYGRPHAVADYVFGQETQAFHHWRSASRKVTCESLALIQDKSALAESLAGIGIPVVPTIRCVARGTEAKSLAEPMDGLEEVLCKNRSGSQGRNTFAAWRTKSGLAGLSFAGQPLNDSRQVERAWRQLLRHDDALIQPRLKNHPALAPVTDGRDAITVRFITHWAGEAPVCLDATLEIPAGRDLDGGRARYVVLPLRPENGELLPVPPEVLLAPSVRARAESLVRNAPTDRVPEWGTLVHGSLRAHACFPDIWAIAWDWVVTPEGPVLLEGNSGWGTATPQVFHGGFLGAGIGPLGVGIYSASADLG